MSATWSECYRHEYRSDQDQLLGTVIETYRAGDRVAPALWMFAALAGSGRNQAFLSNHATLSAAKTVVEAEVERRQLGRTA